MDLAHIDWNGYDVAVEAYARDTLRDGWCAITQIRYEVRTDGAWAGHWHDRQPAVDCTDGDPGVFSPAYRSHYDTRNLRARACVGYSDGPPHACTART
ncbi:hypothetical protein RM780_17400 [Streptomyces sp. DSM 44917]|uniref:Uncharacterized protein n=1 Tax=Streptomyces boetiae TaxID=3075541 RepID=A0ABU2LAZ7_9ACTN|nr:hypothetical protein [Streptomyces sp. DSM 44917]MDT0308724.1 hypothetical protein [Streptomyces sp. DSM 44917]